MQAFTAAATLLRMSRCRSRHRGTYTPDYGLRWPSDGRLSLRASISDLLNNNMTSTTVAAPTYAANSSSHMSSRYLTFGLTWRIGKLDLEYQARGGAAGQ